MTSAARDVGGALRLVSLLVNEGVEAVCSRGGKEKFGAVMERQIYEEEMERRRNWC